MPENEHATPGELEVRLGIIRELKAQGLTQARITRYCLQKYPDWSVTDRTIRNYCAAVEQQYDLEAAGISRAALTVRTLDRLDFLYMKAVEIADYRTALSVTCKVIDLFTLTDPQFASTWQNYAKQKGLSPSELFERMVNTAIESGEIVDHAAETADS